MGSRIGVDVGGTFTDLILFDDESNTITIGKDASTSAQPDKGVVNVVDSAAPGGLGQATLFLHGTTVGLNAILERKGAAVGLLTTRGFRDILAIRRSSRAEMYNLTWSPPPPLVSRPLRLEAGGRILANGEAETALDEDDVRIAGRAFKAAAVGCVAVVLINSHANPSHELAAERLLREAGFEGEIALSHRVTGEYSEYERTSTTVIDAYVRPTVTTYFRRLESGLREREFRGDCLVTRSGGGAMFFEEAEGRPFETVMSGPVAGVAGAVRLCAELGIDNAVTADVGGTSFDTSLIVSGQPIVKYEGEVAGLPLQTPWVDVRSIGAGGGSIARAEAGLLRVGPHSAGAVPGPVCYRRGGSEPTVTDALASLGMLGLGKLAGGLELDIDGATAAVETVGRELGLGAEAVAAGIVSVASAAMAQAIIEITVERGEDPRDAAIIAFGGAGPLFGCLLARELGISTVVIPNAAGNFSAWGLLCQDVARSLARTKIQPLADETVASVEAVARELFDELEAGAADASWLGTASHEVALDLRYFGQEHTITVPARTEGRRLVASASELREVFSADHERHYGHRLELPVEIVNVRATVRVLLPTMAPDAAVVSSSRSEHGAGIHAYSFDQKRKVDFELVDRASLTRGARLAGPAVIVEETTITYVDTGFTAEVHPTGALFLRDLES
jgi:N-methylhydantoinase A